MKRIGALILAMLTLGVGLSLFSTRAYAVFVDMVENGMAGHLTLAAPAGQPNQFLAMSPGSVEQWQVAAELVDPSAPLTLQFTRDGSLVSRPDGLTVEAELCPSEWDTSVTPAVCLGGGASTVFGPLPASDSFFGPMTANGAPVPAAAPAWSLGTITNAADKFLLVTMSIPYTPTAAADQSLMGLTSTFAFGLTASGAGTAPPAPSRSLANTGGDIIALGMTAWGAIALGLLMRSVRRARMVRFDEGSRP